MCSVTSILLFALFAHAHGKELAANDDGHAQDSLDKVFDEVLSKLFDKMSDDWSLNVSSLQHADLDSTTLGKPGQLGLPLQANPSARVVPGFSQRAPQQSASNHRVKHLARAVPQPILKSQKLAKVAEAGSASTPLKPEVVTPSEVIEAQATSATTPDDRQAWNLMSVANQALERNNYVAGLCFALAAATFIIPEFAAEANAATAAIPDTAAAAAASVDLGAILQKSATKALGGGSAGATAAVVQVVSLMWLRTAMNYQYRYGGNLPQALKKLTDEGGIGRLYQGLPFALVQGPLSRFGDTATNVGILALFDGIPSLAGVPPPLRTAAASASAGLWRIFCMPVDTSKTAMQVEGAEGMSRLIERIKKQGPAPLYQGSIATAVATFAGNYPWFLTYNTLDGYLPPISKEETLKFLIRSAFLGLTASCVSDTVSNSLRVIKTTQQTAALKAKDPTAKDGEKDGISVAEAIKLVLDTDGIKGLFGRGLQTRLLTNAIQGALFSVLWRYFQNSPPR